MRACKRLHTHHIGEQMPTGRPAAARPAPGYGARVAEHAAAARTMRLPDEVIERAKAACTGHHRSDRIRRRARSRDCRATLCDLARRYRGRVDPGNVAEIGRAHV